MIGYNPAAIALSPKEKAFFGNAGQPVLNEYFLTELSVLDATVWTITEDTGTIRVVHGLEPSYCEFDGGTGAGDDQVINTHDFKYWSATKSEVTTVFWKSRIKTDDILLRSKKKY